MKRTIAAILILLCYTQANAQLSDFVKSNFNRIKTDNEFKLPWYAEAIPESKIQAKDFPQLYASQVLKSKKTTFKLVKTLPDDLGFIHEKYVQYYNNIEVLHGSLTVHSINGWVESFNGNIYPIEPSNTSQILSTKDCFIELKEELKTNKFSCLNREDHSWSNYVSVEEVKLEKIAKQVYAGQFNKTYGGDFKLCQTFIIQTNDPHTEFLYAIATNLGNVHYREQMMCDADSNGTGNTYHRGVKNMHNDFVSGSATFRLRNTSHYLETFNGSLGTDFTDSSNTWNVTAQRPAYDVHWGSGQTYDFVKNTIGYSSYDNNSGNLVSILNFGGSGNAFWSLAGKTATFLAGKGTNIEPCVAIDVVGHEFGHGIAAEVGGLTYTGQSCMLHESFADINGQNVEWHSDSTKHNWRIGEEVFLANKGIRNMQDPHTFSHPKNYLGKFWGGGCHNPGEVQNYLYYLLVQGDTGTNDFGLKYSLSGMGRKKANKIYYRNMEFYVTPSHQFTDMATSVLKACKDIYGQCSPEFQYVYQAWKVVNLEDTSQKVDLSHGIAHAPVYCIPSVPYTVTFGSSGDVGRECTWVFAPGDTLRGKTVTKAFTKTGSYQVRMFTEVCDSIFIDTSKLSLYYVPEATFSMAPTNLCQTIGDSISFTNSTINVDSVFSLQWDWTAPHSQEFGDKKDFKLTKDLLVDEYRVILTASYFNLCKDTYSMAVAINANPKGSFTTKNSCEKNPLKITNTTDTVGSNLSFKWSIDGQNSAAFNPLNITLDSGVYTVQLKTTNNENGCFHKSLGNVTILNNPKPNFDYKDHCRGGTLLAWVKTTHNRGISYFEWVYDIYKPLNKDSIRIALDPHRDTFDLGLRYVDNKGCTGFLSKAIVLGYLDVDFTSKDECLGSQNYFKTNATYNGDKPKYIWALGDGTVISDVDEVNHLYTDTGKYKVVLRFENGVCENTKSKEVQVLLSPKAKFSASNACANDSVRIINTSNPAGVGMYTWKLGDGSFTGTENPVHKYEVVNAVDNFNIELIVGLTNGCSNTSTKTVAITKNPVSNFTYYHGGQNKVYVFTNTSTGASSYNWDFGDGNTSTIESPTHTYSTLGSRKVKLVVGNDSGCSGIRTVAIDVSLGNYDLEIGDLLCVPNPANKSLQILGLLYSQDKYQAQIVSMDGREILKSIPLDANNNSINIENLAAGNYFIYIEGYKPTRFIKID